MLTQVFNVGSTTQNRKVLIFGRQTGKSAQKAPLKGRYLSLRERANSMGFVFPSPDDKYDDHCELMSAFLTPAKIQVVLGNTMLTNCSTLSLPQNCRMGTS